MSFDMIKKFVLHKDHAPWFIALLLAAALTTAGVIIFSAGGGKIQSAKAAGIACPFGTDTAITVAASTSVPASLVGEYYDCTESTVTITNNSVVTLESDLAAGTYADIRFGDLIVDAGSKISADGQGCKGSSESTGPNLNGQCMHLGQGAGKDGAYSGTALSSYAYGGAHGGKGGAVTNAAANTIAQPYGSSDDALTFGASGGALLGSSGFPTIAGGAGGGIVKIAASSLTLAGTISANGEGGATNASSSTTAFMFLFLGAPCNTKTSDTLSYCPQYIAVRCGQTGFPACTALPNQQATVTWGDMKTCHQWESGNAGCGYDNSCVAPLPSNCIQTSTSSATIQSGGGAGGSVNVTVSGSLTISGSGKFEAKGGSATLVTGTGGAGGHIVVKSSSSYWATDSVLAVNGGTSPGSYNGGKGTAYTLDSVGNANIFHGFGYENKAYTAKQWIVDATATNQSCLASVGPTLHVESAIFRGLIDCTILAPNSAFALVSPETNPGLITFENVKYYGAPETWLTVEPDQPDTLKASVVLRGTDFNNNTYLQANINWDVAGVDLDENASYVSINANGLGCGNGKGPNASNVCVVGGDGVATMVSLPSPGGQVVGQAGGGHGNVGGNGQTGGTIGGVAYDASDVLRYGASGGRNGVSLQVSSISNSRGGGVVRIYTTGNFKWNSGQLISVNGSNGASADEGEAGGGGAGGSINIHVGGNVLCPTYSSVAITSQTLLAKGGNGSAIFSGGELGGNFTGTAYSGGGAGGHIRLFVGGLASCVSPTMPVATIAKGGTATSPAQAGQNGTYVLAVPPPQSAPTVASIAYDPIINGNLNAIRVTVTDPDVETPIQAAQVQVDGYTVKLCGKNYDHDNNPNTQPLNNFAFNGLGQAVCVVDLESIEASLFGNVTHPLLSGSHSITAIAWDTRGPGLFGGATQASQSFDVPAVNTLYVEPASPKILETPTYVMSASSADLIKSVRILVDNQLVHTCDFVEPYQASVSCVKLDAPALDAGDHVVKVEATTSVDNVASVTRLFPVWNPDVTGGPIASNTTTTATATPDAPLSLSLDGGSQLMVPAGALTTSTLLSVLATSSTPVQAIPNTVFTTWNSIVYQFGPPGTTFQTPVTVRIPITEDSQNPIANPVIWWSNPAGDGYVALNTTIESVSTVDTTTNTLVTTRYAVALVDHFSFGFVAPLTAAVPTVTSVTHAPAQALTTGTVMLSGAGQVAVDGDASMNIYYRLATDPAPGNLLQTCPITGALAGTTYTCDSAAVQLPAGQYVTTVKMTDSLVQTGEATENFEMFAPPSATVALNPASNIFTVNPLTVTGTGSDDKSVTSVLVAVDSSSLSYHSEQSCASSPCDLVIAADTLSPGTDYVATVTVTDVDSLTAVATENFSVFGPLSVTGSWTPELVARDIQVTLHGDAGYSLGVQKIEIRLDGTETSTPKKTCTFTTMKLTASCDYGAIVLAPGVHTLRVKVYGNDASTLTDTKTFTVDPVTGPPGAAVLAKTTTGNFSVGDTVTLYATATDDVAVKSLEVYLDDPTPSAPTGMPKKICPTPPLVGTGKTLACSIAVGKLTAGTHTATARSFDAESSASHTITFEVVNGSPVFVPATKPLLNFPTPTDGDSLIVTYKATDDLAVQKLEIYLNGALKTTYPVPPKLYTGKALQYSYTLGKLLSGDYTVSAIAYDSYGSTASEVTSFHVTNNAPVATGSATVVRNKVTTQVDQTTPATAFETVSLKGTGTDGRGVMRVEIYLDPQPGPLEGQTINKACDYTGTPVYTRTCASSALVRSMGTHVVGVRVRDNEGVWSEDNPAARTFNVALPASKIINISMVPNTTTPATALKYINLAFPAATIQPGGYSGTVTYDLSASGLTLNSVNPAGSGACLSNIVQNGQMVTATATNCSGTVYLKGMNLTAPDEPAGSTVAKNWPGVFTLTP